MRVPAFLRKLLVRPAAPPPAEEPPPAPLPPPAPTHDLPSILAAARAAAGDAFCRVHYSQFGEDVVLLALLENFGRMGKPGFYVDVGCFQPREISNTHMLRHHGWRGLNIDGNADAIDRFKAERPDDISLCAFVSDTEEEVEYSLFEEGALNTADPGLRSTHLGNRRGFLRTEKRRTQTLRSLLDAHLPPGQTIDLMSVDAEGFDLRVLRSNDWDRFGPFFLIVEDHKLSFKGGIKSKMFAYLETLGYRLVAQCFVTSIYVRDAR